MTSINYDAIFESFLGDITDYDFANLSMDESYLLMIEYLHKALSETYLRRIFSEMTLDDTSKIFSYEMVYSVNDESDREFVVNVISKGMVYAWLKKLVMTRDLSDFLLATKEQKYYSQATHLTELRNLRDNAYKEFRNAIQDHGWIYNSYIGGTL